MLLLFGHFALRRGNAAASRCHARLRTGYLVLRRGTGQAHDGRAAAVTVVVQPVERGDLTADRSGYRLFPAVCERTGIRGIYRTLTGRIDGRSRSHSLRQCAGRIVHRDHNAEYFDAVARNTLRSIYRGNCTGNFTHCTGWIRSPTARS